MQSLSIKLHKVKRFSTQIMSEIFQIINVNYDVKKTEQTDAWHRFSLISCQN